MLRNGWIAVFAFTALLFSPVASMAGAHKLADATTAARGERRVEIVAGPFMSQQEAQEAARLLSEAGFHTQVFHNESGWYVRGWRE